MSAPAAVVFDNDGLLLDTESVWTRAEEALYLRRGLDFTLEHKRELVGTSAQIAGAILERRLGEEGRAEAIIAELNELVFEELERGVDPMPGAESILAGLRDRGVPLGLVSNSPRGFIDRALELTGFAAAFDAVVSGHEVPRPKPAPDPYLEACARLEVAPATAFALEDSPTGVASARAAGITVIGIPSLPGISLKEADHHGGSLEDPAVLALLGLNGVGQASSDGRAPRRPG